MNCKLSKGFAPLTIHSSTQQAEPAAMSTAKAYSHMAELGSIEARVISFRDHLRSLDETLEHANRNAKRFYIDKEGLVTFSGRQMVQDHAWASMGEKYCKLLGTAAARNLEWTEAAIKLNQSNLVRLLNRPQIQASANPVQQKDLEVLRTRRTTDTFVVKGRKGNSLAYAALSASDLPRGYIFDRYGLIAHENFALPLQSNVQAERTSSADKGESLECGKSPTVPTEDAIPVATSEDRHTTMIPSGLSGGRTHHQGTCSTPLTTPPHAPIDLSDWDRGDYHNQNSVASVVATSRETQPGICTPEGSRFVEGTEGASLWAEEKFSFESGRQPHLRLFHDS
ncbi:hypothetical protein PMIN06_009292, partial [Paraphaeosphaeria minitans]